MTDHLLGGVLGHWALNLDDDKSPMDYDFNNWIELPNGQFQKVNLTEGERTYCNLDMYLMGLLGSNEVGEFVVLRNPVPVGGSTTTFTATSAWLNIQNFIAQEGPRIPSAATAPKYWRQAFIVLTKDIHKAHDLVDTVDFLRLRWEQDYMRATKELGRIDTVLEMAAEVLGLVRRAKTTAKRSMRAPVAVLTVTNTAARLAALAAAEQDVRDAGGVVELVTQVGDEAAVEVELAEE